MRYETAAAFRRALTDHLINRARREGGPVNRLQKQVTFERFLARLFRGERVDGACVEGRTSAMPCVALEAVPSLVPRAS